MSTSDSSVPRRSESSDGEPSLPSPPSPAPADRLRPTGRSEREPVLDGLRGFALLGILLVNIHLMRGPEIWQVIAGTPIEPTAAADRVVAALTGWLVSGKFLSSFAILFGIGAALIAGRAQKRGRQPRRLLARRYLWLLVFGLGHMLLLFPGDILFLYGLSGLALLMFLHRSPRFALRWALALIAGLGLVFGAIGALGAVFGGPFDMNALTEDPAAGAFTSFAQTRAEQAVTAFTDGSYLDVVVANAWQAVFVQSSQLLLVPWVLGLFLLGFAVGRAGWIGDLAARRSELGRLAVVGVMVGLPLNLPLAAAGPLGSDGPAAEAVMANPPLAFALGVAQLVGAPLLAVGYLAASTLLFLHLGTWQRLAAVGRMALTAYLAQSLLALLVFAGFGLYGRLGTAQALLVVAGIWALLLVACPVWFRGFALGPVEWAWRTLTYGRGQRLRA
jgi:uncharacterized protein